MDSFEGKFLLEKERMAGEQYTKKQAFEENMLCFSLNDILNAHQMFVFNFFVVK